jgi:CheY-like chemotaxis protein/two-component sensor histidine kinase
VTRLIRGQIRLRRERLDLARLVRSAAEDFRAAAEALAMRMAVDAPQTPVWVEGDATRLSQVVANLLDNALKFRDGGDRVELTLKADHDNGQAVLTVRDRGVGIEPDLLPVLFDTFAQADRSLHRSKGGLGLGLALVKGLVGLHGGEVRAASAGRGRGAEFTVLLPLLREPAALEPGSGPSPPQRDYRRLRVLVVEDNHDAADSLQVLLTLLGHEVRVAYTGPDGVRAASEWLPEVVISDVGLPGLDGYGVAAELRRNPATANVRLIAVTGYGSEEDRRRALQSGFDHHLTKPADAAVLQRLISGTAP